MKPKRKSLNFIIPLVVYPFDVMVSFGETNEQVAVRLAKIGLPPTDIEMAMIRNDTVRGRACMFSSNQSFLRLTRIPEYDGDFAHLQHEVFHIVNFVMDTIGMEYKTGISDEAYAYLVQYITKQIYDKLH